MAPRADGLKLSLPQCCSLRPKQGGAKASWLPEGLRSRSMAFCFVLPHPAPISLRSTQSMPEPLWANTSSVPLIPSWSCELKHIFKLNDIKFGSQFPQLFHLQRQLHFWVCNSECFRNILFLVHSLGFSLTFPVEIRSRHGAVFWWCGGASGSPGLSKNPLLPSPAHHSPPRLVGISQASQHLCWHTHVERLS